MRFLTTVTLILLSLVSSADSSIWYHEYKRALRLPETEACAVFRALAEEQNIPVGALAVVRKISSCQENDLPRLRRFLDDPGLTWAHPLVSRLAFELAKRQNDKAALLQLTDVYLKYNEFRRQQEEALLLTIAAAEALHDQNAKSKFENRLWRLSPRRHPAPPPQLWKQVAEDYKLNRQWQNSVDVYERIFAHSSQWNEKLDALDGVRRALKEKFRDPEAGGTVEEFLNASRRYGRYAFDLYRQSRPADLEEQRQLMLAWFQYGRALWSYAATAGEQKEGVRQIIEKFLALENNPAFLQVSAFYLASRVSQNYKEFARGAQEAEKALALLNGIRTRRQWNSWQQELNDDLLWLDAFLTRKKGDLASSLEKMKTVTERSFNEWARRRGQFWAARTLKQLGHSEQALASYQQLVQRYPFHYYSLWARYDAGLAAAPIAPMDNSSPPTPAEVSPQNHRLILALVQAGEAKLARTYLNTLLNPASTRLDHLLYRDFVGDHSTVLNAFFSYMNSAQQDSLLASHTSLLFPTPHLNLVRESADRWPYVDQHYIYSIMRQESTFDPFSHSWADARGLLQLVPRVAEAEKAKAGIDYRKLDELFLPEVNIPIGSAALDSRFAVNFNNFIIATGSYNAGEPRVHGWWKNLFSGDVFEFLEEIPVEETRLYIRLVANNYFVNLRLHSQEAVTVPDRLFELGPMPSALIDSAAPDRRRPDEPDVFSPLSNF